MTVILQDALPDEMSGPKSLPGVAPCPPDGWLRVDEVYAQQMAYRAHLLTEKRAAVLWREEEALEPAQEVLEEALAILPSMGFAISEDRVTRPDGAEVGLDWASPLETLGHLVQEDICLMQKRGEEHVLTGAVLCFPASWRLAEKAGRPLIGIHAPVEEYDADLAKRVQRLFNGVRAGRPLWRFNRLKYVEADLFQPWRKAEQRAAVYLRAERQCLVRMPRTQAVVFTIHSYVVRGDKVETE